MRQLRERANNSHGFTLVEMLVSVALVTIVISGFITFLISTSQTQRSLNLEKAGMRALAAQVDASNAIRWDDLMLTPAGTPTTCALDSNRASTQALRPGAEIVNYDSITVSVTRNVAWADNDVPVTCTAGALDRPALKRVTITVKWKDGSSLVTRSATILRSRWTEK
jgi:prepilin-type N-terminal cleavage/methylation domain-containing protein